MPFIIIMLVFQEPSLLSIVIGFLLVLTGELMRFWGVSYAGSSTRTTSTVGAKKLIVSGAFAHTRNPLYLGNILIYTGIGVMSMALTPYLPIIAVLFFSFQYYLIVKEEEEFLIKTFGDKYIKYKKSVPKFVPSLNPYISEDSNEQEFRPKAGLKSERRTLQAITVITIIIILTYILRI